MERPRLQRLPLAGTLALHLLLIGLLFFTFDSRPPKSTATPATRVEIVEATSVDAAKVQAELKRLQRAKAQAAAEQRRRTQEKQRQAEAKRQAALEKKRKAEAARKAEAEKARQAKLKRQQEERERRLAEEAKRRKIEAERKQREEFERKQREFEEAQRREEEQRRQEAEKALQAKLAAEEQARRTAARRAQLDSLQLEYIGLIADKVTRAWIRPAGSGSDFSCKVLVNQLPTGEVIAARITRSCGTAALDRSVERAVLKASPLPRPSDPELFQREIEFEFTP